MGYRNLQECVRDLEATRQLVRIDEPIDPCLELAEIQRRLFRARGPAVLFTRVKGCQFPMLANLFGTMERVRHMFRDTLDNVRRLVELQVDPADLLRRPRLYLKTPWTAWHARPGMVKRGPVLAHQTTIDLLPQLKSWPADGGAYITLPQVYTEDPENPGLQRSNLGMYRVQLSGGKYHPSRDIGLHYQIHRGIAAHHAAAIRMKKRLRVNIFVGGPPAMTVAAVMPLPEGISELAFAGMLGGRRVRMIHVDDKLPIHAEADFCIVGHLDPVRQLPEGPFGDHLGYYSLEHDFPVMIVERVYHRQGAIWPFTVVGRPPQEDSMFSQLIHELAGPVIPRVVPGVRAVHAVEAAGVHPLLLAIGSERYVPYEERRRPRELLTLANALLGQGQLSLAKYLLIVAGEDNADLDIHDVREFFHHLLERVDWRRDLHFQTCTTIDTLDYSGTGLNEGSKLVIAAAGPAIRNLPVAIDSRITMPEGLGFKKPRVFLPGILVVEGPACQVVGRTSSPSHEAAGPVSDPSHDAVGRISNPSHDAAGRTANPSHNGPDRIVDRFCAAHNRRDAINGFPLVVVVDSADVAAKNLDNFLWTTFTRSNPAADLYGIEAFIRDKHWGCFGSLVIDARTKPHHAPPLVEDPEVTKRVDALGKPGGPLHGLV
jgi:4-hydroxy-3-polyprenylbenzoate decarboxylase